MEIKKRGRKPVLAQDKRVPVSITIKSSVIEKKGIKKIKEDLKDFIKKYEQSLEILENAFETNFENQDDTLTIPENKPE